MVVTTQVNVTVSGPFFQDPNFFENRLLKAAERVAEQGQSIAKASYLSQKKKDPKLPSRVIDSFGMVVNNLGAEKQVKAIVFAGGPAAPHAIWTDQPRKLRNGKTWPGYKYMETGAKAAAKVAPEIVKNELSK